MDKEHIIEAFKKTRERYPHAENALIFFWNTSGLSQAETTKEIDEWVEKVALDWRKNSTKTEDGYNG